MTIEERRAELVAFVENEYGGQEVLKLADAYALAVLEETRELNMDCDDCWVDENDPCGYHFLRQRIEVHR